MQFKMPFHLVLCALSALILTYIALPAPATARAPKVLDRTMQRSADGTLVATVLSLKQPHSYGDSPSRVEIRSTGGLLLASRDHSALPDQGYTVTKAAWTADSRYFVYIVSNSGGHSPWHHPIFFYSRGRNRFYSLDSALAKLGHGPGEVTGGMALRSPCTVVTQARYYGKSQAGLRTTAAKDGSGEQVLAINLTWLEGQVQLRPAAPSPQE